MRSYSLKTFLATILFLATLLALGTLQVRYWKLESEVVRLRREAGYLGPIDKSRINIVEVPSPTEPYTWRWRIYAPAGTVFDCATRTNNIPAEGLPKKGPSSLSKGLEFESTPEGVLIAAGISHDVEEPEGGHCLTVHFDGLDSKTVDPKTGKTISRVQGSNSYTSPLPPGDWFGGGTFFAAGSKEVATFKHGEPIILYRSRLEDSTGMIPDGDAHGFMIWLIPKRKP